VPVESVPCTGISSLTASDFAFAKSMGCTIKLVGTALLLEPQPAAAAATTAAAAAAPSIAVFVSPVLAPLAHPLATARGAGNMVVVSSANCDQSVFAGPGAGRFPTANSVISDVLRLARGLCSPAFPLEAQCTLESDFSARFYVRAAAAERGAHVLAELGTLAQAAAVEVVSLQWGQGSAASEFVVTTAQCKHSQIKQLCTELSGAAWTQGSPVFMSLL
jgi:homoserine dehydrogenase